MAPAKKRAPAKKPTAKKKPTKKQTSDRLSKIAAKALRGEELKKSEILSLAGSVLSQDETKGSRSN